ncbi:hypothetical protein PUG81_08755 [Erwiniaceae bacterium L1_54_6]|jgi:hypothetical protein|nr:hypothetical protein [Erwiniaceae bacterium L1_54_6]
MRDRQAAGDDYLYDLKEAFKVYWSKGFHPDIGQDAHFAKPSKILTLSVRKSHIRQDTYSNKYGWISVDDSLPDSGLTG